MKINTKVELGIIALTDIAVHSEDGQAVRSSDIAARQNISHKYLEQILLALRQGKFVKSQKGIHGGYQLSRPADKILLCDVLNALDTNILANSCELDDDQASGIRASVNNCLWSTLNSNMRRFVEKMTLDDLIKEYKQDLTAQKDYMYYI
ncbi:MAG: Rrf2 family transcriptional regulator [Ruminococcus sp.]|nr:Rrf2 family transcriptional regulator [Ruminococcus sp.]